MRPRPATRLFWTAATILTAAPLSLAAAPARFGPAAVQAAADEQALKTAGFAADGPALVRFLRARAPDAGTRARLTRLAKDLGDRSFPVRERAKGELTRAGPVALPFVRPLLASPDPEVASRARKVVDALGVEQQRTEGVVLAAVRLTGWRRPDGAIATLLDYLPFSESEAVADQTRAVLAALARRQDEPDPALLAGLTDPVAAVRAGAGKALAAVPALRARVKLLLGDPDRPVRLHVGLALADVGEPEAVPVLIELLADLTAEQAVRVEEFLHRLAGEAAPEASVGTDRESRQQARTAWKTWWDKNDGPAVEKFFKDRTPDAEKRARLTQLAKDLGDRSFPLRQQASRELAHSGPVAMPFVRPLQDAPDAEVARRARAAVTILEDEQRKAEPAVLASARLLALRRPPEAVPVLLNYLPFAESEAVADEVCLALAALARRAERPDPLFLEALTGPNVARRAGAGAALAGVPGLRGRARSLLNDPEPGVRLRVGLALVGAGDAGAVPSLIDLLTDAAPGRSGSVETLLAELAGDQAPVLPAGTDRASRRQARDAWKAWWAKNGAAVELAGLSEGTHYLNHTLVLHFDPNFGTGILTELGPDKKPRWKISNLRYPLDVAATGRDRVLVAEFQGNRVAEWDRNGKIVWEKQFVQPVACQRLPNGQTFMASRNQILVVDRGGKTLQTVTWPQYSIMGATRTRDGRTVLATSLRKCVTLDAAGKEVSSFPIAPLHNFCHIEVLPGGRVLIPEYTQGRVVEYDSAGKVLWQATVQYPTSAQRLPNGNTLVVSQTLQSVLELDPKGKTVWDYRAPGQPIQARRR